MSFTVLRIGSFFTLGLAYLFQKILERSYWRSFAIIIAWWSVLGDMLRRMLK
jgi:hypothetical protein